MSYFINYSLSQPELLYTAAELNSGLHADSSHEESLSRSKWNRFAKLSGFHNNRTRSSSANVKLWLCVSPGPKTRKGGAAIMAFRGRVPPKRGIFLRLQVCKKGGITRVEVYTMVGKTVLLVCRVILLNSWNSRVVEYYALLLTNSITLFSFVYSLLFWTSC